MRLVSLLVFFCSYAAHAEIDLRLSGYAKSYVSASRSPLVGEFQFSLANTLRVKLATFFSENFVLDLAYDLSPSFSPPNAVTSSVSLLSAPTYRLADFNALIYPNPRQGYFYLNHNLDRVLFTWRGPGIDVSLGRQPISFGAARVVNPTDVLTPFSFDALDVEERRGIDALRVKFPLGPLAELDLGWVFGANANLDESAAFIRSQFNWIDNTIVLTGVWFRHNLLLGVNLQRAIGPAGFWFEGAHTWSRITGTPAPTENYVRFSTGLDYNFSEGIFGFIEYHFNGAGASLASNYIGLFSTERYQDGILFLFGQHYLAPGMTWQAHPLLSISGSVLTNLNDPSVFLSLRGEYSFADNLYSDLGVYWGLGQAPFSQLQLQSEYGAYPLSFFGSVRYYF